MPFCIVPSEPQPNARPIEPKHPGVVKWRQGGPGPLGSTAQQIEEDLMAAQTHTEAEIELIEAAKRVLPAASFGNMAGDVVIREGRGGRVWDESGNEYVDFL